MKEQQPLFNSARNDHGNQQTDGFYLNLVFLLPCQRIVNNLYECVFLSALAAMSIKCDATYMPPNNLTTLFAALIAIFCALILSAAQNYLVKCSRRPGAMAWIWHTFSYAKVISQITMQPVLCYWNNDVLFNGPILPHVDILHRRGPKVYCQFVVAA
jgi:hypothetical protein